MYCGFLLLCGIICFGFTSFAPLLGMNPASRDAVEQYTEDDELVLKLQTCEKLWQEDVNRYFWTVFIHNTILRENSDLDSMQVVEWANVWYLACSETGEDIPLTLAIAHVESATWERIEGLNTFVPFHPQAISPQGAIGLFQLMIPTAREVADELGIYYDRSVESTYDAIIGVRRDTSTSPEAKKMLIRRMILDHADKHPESIEAVTLNPINNITMGIYYFAHLNPANRAGLPIEGRIESYNAGFAGYMRGWGRAETVPYRENVLRRYRVYEKQADSARLKLWATRPARADSVEPDPGPNLALGLK